MRKSKFDFESLTRNPETGDGIVTVMKAGPGQYAVVAMVYPTMIHNLNRLSGVLKASGFEDSYHYSTEFCGGQSNHISFIVAEDEAEKAFKFFIEVLEQSRVMVSPIVCDYTELDLILLR